MSAKSLELANERIEALEKALLRTNQTRHGVNIEGHEEDKRRRLKAREGKSAVLDDCTDPTKAAEYEARKPHYYYSVTATWKRPSFDPKTGNSGGLKPKTETVENIIAQNDAEAWSLFCDAVGDNPNPNQTKREVTRGNPVPLATLMAVRMTPNYRDNLSVST